jgi:ribonuclease HIII
MPKTNGRATLEQVIAIVNRLEDKMDKILDDHAKKIDCLESGQAKMFGGLAVVAAIWSWFFNKFQ